MAADVVLAAVLASLALVSLAATYDQIRGQQGRSFHPTGTVAAVVWLLAITLPQAWRRQYPLTVATAVTVAFLGARIIATVPETSVTTLAIWLAIYSAAVHGHKPARTWVLSLCYGAVVAELAREVFFLPRHEPISALSFLLFYNVVVVLLPWLLGAAIRALREHQRELADQAVELQREREENARQAVFAERVRIARELHDVVAHHVSVMGVQAAGARRVLDRQPELAAEALSSIEASSRQAVGEMHGLLGFLRRADEADDPAPQPGLAQLGDLVAQSGEAELTVDLRIEGEPRPLSATLEVSAYRVVQEALTNTRKHSGTTSASVRVRYGVAALEVEVLDEGPGAVASAEPTHYGHGLIGMRERAVLHGGYLRAGPRPEGGFGVYASFPLHGKLG
jgi:signal transduction histidine kinase